MRHQWGFTIGSTTPSDSWRDYAIRLRRVLDTISARFAEQYGALLEWYDEFMGVEQWHDIDKIAEVFPRYVHDGGYGPWPDMGYGGVMLGRLPGAAMDMVHVSWDADTKESYDGSWFGLTITVHTKKPERGDARLLLEHPLDWLILLLCDIARTAQATDARLNYSSLGFAVVDYFMEQESNADTPDAEALTLVPDGIDPALLPPSLTPYPCPVGYPDGTVVAVNLQQATNDPESLVPDLITFGKLLKAQKAG